MSYVLKSLVVTKLEREGVRWFTDNQNVIILLIHSKTAVLQKEGSIGDLSRCSKLAAPVLSML